MRLRNRAVHVGLLMSRSLLGFTMDLNVFGFMERFDREYTANFIDSESRYRYDRQPEMMRWNLRKLAEVRWRADY